MLHSRLVAGFMLLYPENKLKMKLWEGGGVEVGPCREGLSPGLRDCGSRMGTVSRVTREPKVSSCSGTSG